MQKAFKAILAMILCFSLCFCALALTSCDDDKSDADTNNEEKADKEEKDNKDNKDDKKETDSGDKTDNSETDSTDNNGDATDGADEGVNIVVAKNDVAKGSRITSKDVELVEIDPEALAAYHLTDRADAIGKYALEAISKGETIKTSMISGTPAGVGGSGNGSATVDPSALGYVVITDYVQPNTGKDVSAQIQKAIDENPQKTIYFPDGEYILGEPIKTSGNPERAVSLNLSNFAELKAADGWSHGEAMVRLGGAEQSNNIHLPGSNYYFMGGIVNGNGSATGISIESGRETLITRTSIKNTHIGIHIMRGANSGSSDADIEGVNIVGNALPNSIGVFLQGHDNTLTNMRIAAVEVGVMLASGTNSLRNIHPLYIFAGELHEKDPEMYDGVERINYASSVGFYDVSGGTNWYDFCYSDQMATGFRFGSGQSVFQNCFVMWYSTNGNHEVGFDCTGRFNSSILNCQVWLKNGVETCTFFRTASDGFGIIENPIFDATLDREGQYVNYLYGKVLGNT